MKTADMSQIDTRFEGYRLKDTGREKQLLGSIAEHGIRDPLQCVEKSGGELILLDGFKRLRCCKQLKIKNIPVTSIGSDEAGAILQFMRSSSAPVLSMLEQALLIDELSSGYSLGVREIARHLERSPAWVSMRLGIIGQMSPAVRAAVFSGRFPVRSYMYTIRVFTRVNSVKKSDIDAFVNAVSGKELSIRTIELLAQGFFKGSPELKAQILGGNINWTLKHLMQQADEPRSDIETRTLKELELVHGCIIRLPYKLADSRLQSDCFFLSAHALAGKILNNLKRLEKALEEFHGDSRKHQASGKNTV
jgi:hypothetical protein